MEVPPPLPELGVHQRVIIQKQGLQLHQPPHLGGQALQFVVTQIQVKQVGQVDEELVGDTIYAAGAKREVGRVREKRDTPCLHLSGRPCLLPAPRPARQRHLSSQRFTPQFCSARSH